jgi:hypothetical protein
MGDSKIRKQIAVRSPAGEDDSRHWGLIIVKAEGKGQKAKVWNELTLADHFLERPLGLAEGS